MPLPSRGNKPEQDGARHSADQNKPEPTDQETASSPTVTEGGGIATRKQDEAADRPGFHCGYCGSDVGAEGQHWDSNGEAAANPHAGTLVVANDWPEYQDSQDEAKNAEKDALPTDQGPTGAPRE